MRKIPLRMLASGLLLLSGVFLATSLYLFILPPQYGAMTRIRPDPSRFNSEKPSASQGPQNGFGGGSWEPTEFERIQSKVVLFQVISNLDLNRKWGEKFKEGELQNGVTYALLKRQLEVKQATKSSAIEIGVTSDDPREAADIANAITTVYLENRKSRQGGTGGKAVTQSNPEDYLVIGDSVPEIVDIAEPDFHPTKPSRAIKLIVPATGLFLAVVGLGLLALGFAKPPQPPIDLRQ